MYVKLLPRDLNPEPYPSIPQLLKQYISKNTKFLYTRYDYDKKKTIKKSLYQILFSKIIIFLINIYNHINKIYGDHFCAKLRVAVVTKDQDPTSKETSPICCLISCEAKRVMYHYNCNFWTCAKMISTRYIINTYLEFILIL